jgi:hypothetical protein
MVPNLFLEHHAENPHVKKTRTWFLVSTFPETNPLIGYISSYCNRSQVHPYI